MGHMHYEIVKLDNRFGHRNLFDYYIKFSPSMTQRHGPLCFNKALQWFTETYGWSAEVRQYDAIMRWVATNTMIQQPGFPTKLATGVLDEKPQFCNRYWSWSNGYKDLRIYVHSDRELAFFKLKWISDT